MATQEQLAQRILQKAKLLDPQEPADPDELPKGVEKLQAAHFYLRGTGLTRWTLADIPPEAEEAYVFMGASLLAGEAGTPGVDPGAMWLQGLRMVQSFVHIPMSGPTPVENF